MDLFQLTVEMDTNTDYDLAGLSALDRRRELGLSDGVRLRTQKWSQTIAVPESFARQHADRYGRSSSARARMRMADLIRGECTLDEDDLVIGHLTNERLMAIASFRWAEPDLSEDSD